MLAFSKLGLIRSAIMLAIPTIFLLPGHPTRTRWLTAEEKYLALERVRLNNTGTQNTEFKWAHVKECFMDLKTWGFVLMSEYHRLGAG